MDISKLKKVGVDLATFGTPSGSFTRGIYVTNFSDNASQSVDTIKETTGSLANKRVTKSGIDFAPSLTFALDVGDDDSASIGDFLASVLGLDTGTDEGGGDFKHIFKVLSSIEPPALNIWSDKDTTNKQAVGLRVGSIKLSLGANEGMIPVEVTGISQKNSDLASDQTLVFSGAPILTPNDATVIKLGGSDVCFESLEITITREQESVRCIGASRYVSNVASGKSFRIELTATGLQFANETEYNKFMATTSSSFELKIVDSDSHYIHIVIPEMFYNTWEGADISGSDLLRVNIGAIANDEDNSGTPAYVELLNTYGKRYDTGAVIV